MTTYSTTLADLSARAQRWGHDNIVRETRAKLCGMVLARDFGESMESFLERSPFLAEKHRAYTDWLASGIRVCPAQT